MPQHRANRTISRYRVLVTWIVTGTVATAMAVAGGPSATAAGRPGAPEPASASVISGRTDAFRVTWSPAAPNGSALKRYVIKVKGQASPLVRVNPTTLSYDWTGPVAGRSPVTFQVRAVNSVGFGPWALAVVNSQPPSGGEQPPPTEPAPALPTGSGLPYTAGSFFKSRVENAQVNAARTAEFRGFMRSAPDQQGITWPKINMNDSWAMSYHVGRSSDPIWRLKGATPATAACRSSPRRASTWPTRSRTPSRQEVRTARV